MMTRLSLCLVLLQGLSTPSWAELGRLRGPLAPRLESAAALRPLAEAGRAEDPIRVELALGQAFDQNGRRGAPPVAMAFAAAAAPAAPAPSFPAPPSWPARHPRRAVAAITLAHAALDVGAHYLLKATFPSPGALVAPATAAATLAALLSLILLPLLFRVGRRNVTALAFLWVPVPLAAAVGVCNTTGWGWLLPALVSVFCAWLIIAMEAPGRGFPLPASSFVRLALTGAAPRLDAVPVAERSEAERLGNALLMRPSRREEALERLAKGPVPALLPMVAVLAEYDPFQLLRLKAIDALGAAADKHDVALEALRRFADHDEGERKERAREHLKRVETLRELPSIASATPVQAIVARARAFLEAPAGPGQSLRRAAVAESLDLIERAHEADTPAAAVAAQRLEALLAERP